MKKTIAFTLVALLVAAWDATAQPPSHQHPPSGQPAAPATPATPGGGMPPGSMCGMMMGAAAGGGAMPMMGMMGGAAESPRMMQMRGEMMKAMGDILMKYGKMMETPTR